MGGKWTGRNRVQSSVRHCTGTHAAWKFSHSPLLLISFFVFHRWTDGQENLLSVCQRYSMKKYHSFARLRYEVQQHRTNLIVTGRWSAAFSYRDVMKPPVITPTVPSPGRKKKKKKKTECYVCPFCIVHLYFQGSIQRARPFAAPLSTTIKKQVYYYADKLPRELMLLTQNLL